MSLNMSGVVEALGGKDVNTKFGLKPTFSFKVNGQWISAGFKDPKVQVGDNISFEYEPDKYGNKLHDGSIKKGVAVATGSSVSAPSVSGRHGSFPIGPLDGQRSIIRQNALTNARELFVACAVPTAAEDAHALRIIEIARIFEAYTTGDMDMDAAMKDD